MVAEADYVQNVGYIRKAVGSVVPLRVPQKIQARKQAAQTAMVAPKAEAEAEAVVVVMV